MTVQLKSEAEQQELSGPERVTHYNALAAALGEQPVKRFADSTAAIKRVAAIQQRYAAANPPPETGAQEPAAKKPRKAKGEQKGRTMSFRLMPTAVNPRGMRPGTARAAARDALMRPEGAMFEEVMQITGWNRRQAYEGVRILNIHIGYGLWSEPENGSHRIRIVDEAEFKRLAAARQSAAH